MSQFEVVRSNVSGWDVRRVGEAQALTNHAERADAEEAAALQQELENEAGDAEAIDVRQDVFSEGPDEDLDVTRTAIGTGTMILALVVLIAVFAAIAALTGFGS